MENGRHHKRLLSVLRSYFLQSRQEKDPRLQDQDKSWIKLFRVSASVCGIDIAYSAQAAFVAPLMLSMGVEMRYMTMLWALSPLLGVFLIPPLGILSENSRLRFGRRRPFIALYTFFILMGLGLLPWGRDIGLAVTVSSQQANTIGIIFVVLGLVLVDFFSEAGQNASRAYLLDVTLPREQTRGLSAFSAMAGIGGIIGGVLGGVKWVETPMSPVLHEHIKIIYSIVSVLLFVTVMLTITSYAEVLPDNPTCKSEDEFSSSINSKSSDTFHQVRIQTLRDPKECGEWEEIVLIDHPLEEIRQSIQARYVGRTHFSFREHLWCLWHMPRSLRVMCLADLFGWMSFACYAQYFTTFVGSAVFGGTSPLHPRYQDGVRFGSFGIAVSCVVCVLDSYLVEVFIRKFGLRAVYVGGQLIHTLGALAICLLKNQVACIVLSANVGVLYAVLMTLPFIIVARYHKTDQFVAQVVLALGLGSLVDLAGGTQVIMGTCAALGLCGAVAAYFVTYPTLIGPSSPTLPSYGAFP